MDNKDEFEISKKLADISLAMSDGFHFLQIRSLVEDWDRMAKAGDPTAQEAIVMVNKFYGLCKYVLAKGK